MIPHPNDIDPTLVHLMELVYTTLAQERPSWYAPNPDEWRGNVRGEVERIELAWRRFAFITVKPQARKRYVQQQQQTLLHCLQWLEKIDGAEIARESAMIGLYGLLDFLLEHFEKELNKEVLMPSKQQARIVGQLKGDLPVLQKKLHSVKMSPQFRELIVDLFILFIQNAFSSEYAYGQVLLMRSLMAFLLESKLTAAIIFQQLCYLNCNVKAVFKFGVRFMDRSDLTLFEKSHRSRRLSKYFRQMPVKQGCFLDPKRVNLTLQIADYFGDLANYADRQLQLHTREVSTPGAYQDRLALRLTIEQVGLYIRLFKAVEILQPVPTAQIIRFCIKYFRTVGKDPGKEMSYEYLKSSIARQDLAIFNMVERQLDQMLVQLRKFRLEARKSK